MPQVKLIKRVYVTRSVLTSGVVVGDFNIVDGKYASRSLPNERYFVGKSDWYETEEAAKNDVLAKIAKKLTSIDRQRARLEALRKRVKSDGINAQELEPLINDE